MLFSYHKNGCTYKIKVSIEGVEIDRGFWSYFDNYNVGEHIQKSIDFHIYSVTKKHDEKIQEYKSRAMLGVKE